MAKWEKINCALIPITVFLILPFMYMVVSIWCIKFWIPKTDWYVHWDKCDLPDSIFAWSRSNVYISEAEWIDVPFVATCCFNFMVVWFVFWHIAFSNVKVGSWEQKTLVLCEGGIEAERLRIEIFELELEGGNNKKEIKAKWDEVKRLTILVRVVRETTIANLAGKSKKS